MIVISKHFAGFEFQTFETNIVFEAVSKVPSIYKHSINNLYSVKNGLC